MYDEFQDEFALDSMTPGFFAQEDTEEDLPDEEMGGDDAEPSDADSEDEEAM